MVQNDNIQLFYTITLNQTEMIKLKLFVLLSYELLEKIGFMVNITVKRLFQLCFYVGCLLAYFLLRIVSIYFMYIICLPDI